MMYSTAILMVFTMALGQFIEMPTAFDVSSLYVAPTGTVVFTYSNAGTELSTPGAQVSTSDFTSPIASVATSVTYYATDVASSSPALVSPVGLPPSGVPVVTDFETFYTTVSCSTTSSTDTSTAPVATAPTATAPATAPTVTVQTSSSSTSPKCAPPMTITATSTVTLSRTSKSIIYMTKTTTEFRQV